VRGSQSPCKSGTAYDALVGSDSPAWAEKVAELTEKLSNVRAVRVAGAAREDEPPEATLAHALADIEEECLAFRSEYLSRVINATSTDELDDALADLKDGLRHLVYHLKDSPYLRAVLD
jgi:hypothetical protein